MEKEPKKYEITYLLAPSIAEDALANTVQAIHTAIEEEKGFISHSESPRKRHLAYPVGKETSAYFGWTRCTLPPNAISAVEKKIKADPSVIRHIIVEDTIPAMAPPRMPRMMPPTMPAALPKREEEADERLDLEGLDKKLEEILGK